MDTLARVALNNAGWALVLAVGAAVVARFARGRPGLAHAAWLLVLLKLATPGLVGVAWPAEAKTGQALPAPPVESPTLPSPSREEGIGLEAKQEMKNQGDENAIPPPLRGRVGWGVDGPEAPESSTNLPSFRPWLLALWLAGATTWWASVAVQSRRFARLLRSSRPAGADLDRLAGRVAARLGLRRAPEVRMLPARVPPLLWALFGRPRVVLPEGLWADLDGPQREAVLAHELAHLRRRDHWARRLEALVLGLYWWDPVAWWARREVERAEEPCCDAWVTWAFPDSAPSYAEALIKSAAFLSGPRVALPPGASGVGRLPPLKGRLSMILRGPSPRPRPRTILILGALALPLLPALGSSQAQEPDAPKPEPKAKPADQAPSENKKANALPRARGDIRTYETDKGGRPRVTVARPIVREVVDYADYVGRTEAAMSAEIRARVGGQIDEVHVAPGALVKKGDLLFEIDPRTYRIELDRAVAELDRAEARRDGAGAVVSRHQRIGEKNPGVISREEKDQAITDFREAQAGVSAAKAGRDLARLRLDFASVRAPISGRVGRLLTSAGNVAVADQTALASITAIDPISVYFDVDQRTVLNLNRLSRGGKLKAGLQGGTTVRVALSDGDFSLRARVDAVGDQFDSGTGALRVRATLPNPDRSILPGMFARVRLEVGPPRKALLVPADSLYAASSTNLYVVNDRNVVEGRSVKPGQQHGDLVVVEQGLLAGDRVILDAWNVRRDFNGNISTSLGVRHGQAVTPEEMAIPAPPEPTQLGTP